MTGGSVAHQRLIVRLAMLLDAGLDPARHAVVPEMPLHDAKLPLAEQIAVIGDALRMSLMSPAVSASRRTARLIASVWTCI
ncbi:hypothetical protein [Acidisphaera rubrifaciens]|uniref:Uncharacterized protein n=1 Tax=Acidisphaera rubrifaciens HS-AP3 TaxID=1231350 RepID=A0A0D6P8S8_9PROT|nr:hypothetical protein [Acidisphaera rubrifaciens]GAN77264.1 hypothetical protein Asru_0265_12 [Acidisphaera rubrifaciens HS-AP3]